MARRPLIAKVAVTPKGWVVKVGSRKVFGPTMDDQKAKQFAQGYNGH